MAALARARLALARNEAQQALAALDQVYEIALQLSRGALLVKADVLKALALYELGRDDESRHCLVTAARKNVP
ncbi:hypothetical protein D3C84_919980 [compost metagenome]